MGIDLGPGQTRTAPTDPRALQSQLVLASRALLEGLAQRGPVIVAVEDLHWADAASVDLLTLLLELTDFQPLMILVTSRPETEGDAWTFRLHAERSYSHRLTEVRLGPLAQADSQRLADNLLRVSELPSSIRARILERSEGNPFYLEEIIRGLIEEGVLRREGERWTAAGSPEHWTIPTTLRGVIAARIDRLSLPAKAALQRAAVVGRFFSYRTLLALTDEQTQLDRALAHLLRAELIREWAPLPERQYVFKHALTHETAYGSLLAEQRRELHDRVARHLESIVTEDSVDQAVLAHHWYHATEWDRALKQTLRAAERARGLYDRPAAIGHYWRALELFDRLPATEERQREHASTVLALVQLPSWPRDDSGFRLGLGHLDRALQVTAERGDNIRLARLQALKGYIVGDEALLKAALVAARVAGDPLTLAFVADRYGAYLGSSGRWDDALAQYSRCTAIYAEQGVRYQLAMTTTYGRRCYSSRAGKLEDAFRYATEFRRMATELGDARLLAWRAMEGEPYIYQGAWDDVIRVAEESLPVAWRIGETAVILFASAWLGLAYLKVGRLGDARRVLDRALEHGKVSRQSTPYALSYATVAAALTRLAAGEADTALETARRALDFADRSGFRLEQGAAHRALGQAHAATGHRVEADAALRRSLEILEGIHSWPEVGQTLLAYGQFKLGEDPAEARALVGRARALFEKIGATGWVAEAQTALGGR